MWVYSKWPLTAIVRATAELVLKHCAGALVMNSPLLNHPEDEL